MRQKILLLTSILGWSCGVFSEQICNPSKTRAVITGVLSWEDKNVSSFSDENRKDAEFHKLLDAVGVPDSCNEVLLDKQASLVRMTEAVRRQMKACGPEDTFIFYYAGHGSKFGENHYFCTYDMGKDASSLFRVEVLYELAA